MQEAINKMRTLKVLITCKKCDKKIETYWNYDNELDGQFMSLHTVYSVIFDKYLPAYNQCVCMNCYSKGKIIL